MLRTLPRTYGVVFESSAERVHRRRRRTVVHLPVPREPHALGMRFQPRKRAENDRIVCGAD